MLNCRAATIAFAMKPSITPKIRSVAALRTFFDAAMITAAPAPAPMNAAAATEISWKRLPIELAAHKVTAAAPSEAPELMPIICGSAIGLRNMLCICRPASERAAPASIAVTVRGRRSSMRTFLSAGLT